MSEDPRTLTIDEAARLLGLTRKAVEARVSRGSLQSVLRDGRRLVLADEVMRTAAAEDQGAPPAVEADALVEKYAQTKYELGLRDGEARARAQLTDGHDRRERELQERIVALSGQLATAEAVAAEQARQAEELLERLQARKRGFLRRRRGKGTETEAS